MKWTAAILLLSASMASSCQSTPPEPPPGMPPPASPPPDRREPGAREEPGTERLAKPEWTLDDVLALAEAFNPELALERRNVDLATAALWEARLYPNPELDLGIEDYRTRDGRNVGRSKRTVGVSVPLVIGGRIGAATSAAESERDVAAIHFLGIRRELLGQAKLAFVGVLAAEKSVALARETREIARAFRDATRERYDAQAIPEMEVLKADVNLSKAETDVAVADKELALAGKTLLAAIGRMDAAPRPMRGDLSLEFRVPDLAALHEEVVTRHPLVAEATRARTAAERQLSLARTERIPDLGFALAAGRDAEDEEILQAGITIPLGIFNRNQARIEGASIRVDQVEKRRRSTLNDLELRLDEAWRALVTAQQRVGAYETGILPKAQRALDQTNEGYRLGKFAFLDVLDAQRTLAEAKSAFTASVTELNLSAARLETILGRDLAAVR